MVKARILQVHAVDHCNFHCGHCSHGSPQAPKRFYTWEDYRPHVEKLSTYADVGRWDIMGGEPFLNKDLLGFIQGFKNGPLQAPICLVTNAFWIRKWRKHIEVLKNVDVLNITIHPELEIPASEVKALCSEITDEIGLRTLVEVPEKFGLLSFSKEPIKRTHCKFCPQLLASGHVSKCHLIGYSRFYPEILSEGFAELKHEGVYDIHTGDADSFDEWYNGQGNPLHECCNYCRFLMPGTFVEHNNE